MRGQDKGTNWASEGTGGGRWRLIRLRVVSQRGKS